jgi:hypothetical protein
VLIPGITIAMGGRDWIVPPLTLGQLRRLGPQLERIANDLQASMGEAAISAVVDIVTAALSRNYPEITAAQVEELLDLGNSPAVVRAVLTGSGLKPAGEAEAVANSAGATFTASSPPPADTDTAT